MFPTLTTDQAAAFNQFLVFNRGRGGGVGGIYPPVSPFATLQNQPRMPAAMVRDQAEEVEATVAGVAPIIDQSLPDEELLKRQMSMAPAMFDSRGVTPGAGGIGLNYGGMKPIRGGSDELLNNPKFAQLLRVDPRRAAQAYQSLTGRTLGEDFQQKQKMDIARQKDFADTTRSQLMRGDIRQEPETGMFQRRQRIQSKDNPMQTVDTWEDLSADEQEIYAKSWETALGAKMFRPNPIASLGKSPAVKALVAVRYADKVRNGMSPREALEAAILETPEGSTPVSAGPAMSQAQRMAMTGPSDADVTAMEQAGHMNAGSSPEATIQLIMDKRMAERNDAVRQAALSGLSRIGQGASAAAQGVMGTFETIGGGVADTVTSSIPNLINQASQFIGGPKLWDWRVPASLSPVQPDPAGMQYFKDRSDRYFPGTDIRR